MLRIQKQGTEWSVFDEHGLISAHPTDDSAVRAATHLASERGEHVLPLRWFRRHSNGVVVEITLNEDAAVGWQLYVPGGGDFTEASDIQEARDAADAAVRRAGHVCSAECATSVMLYW